MPDTRSISIELQYVWKSFQQAEQPVLQDINATIPTNEFVAIVGPSGCGKSTLLRIIANLLETSRGEITFPQVLDSHVPRTALVFQRENLMPWMTVIDNIRIGLHKSGLSKKEANKRIQWVIERVELDGFGHYYPYQLSGGMQQRVDVARALVSGAPILLMDEPFGSVDAQTRMVLQTQLLRLWREENKTILFVTHDIDEAILLSDRILVMSNRPGRILQSIPNPLPRPRSPREINQPQAQELKWQIWNLLEKPVQHNLSTTSQIG